MSWITASRSGRRTGPKLNNGPAQTRAEGSKLHVSTPRNRRGADTHNTNSSNPVASAGRQSHTCGTRNTNASNGVFNQISGNQCFGGVPIHLMVNPPAPSPQNRQASHSDRSAAERCPKLLVEKRRLQEEVSALMDKRGWDEERRLRKEISGLRTMRQSLSTASESSWDDDGGSTDGGSTDGGKKKCRKRGDGGKKKSRKRGRSGRRGPY